MMTIDEFLDHNADFKGILTLPRVAELIDLTREIERRAWEIMQSESALLETVEQYRRDALNPPNWALVVYKGLLAEAERKVRDADEIIERTVAIRTASLSHALAKANAKLLAKK